MSKKDFILITARAQYGTSDWQIISTIDARGLIDQGEYSDIYYDALGEQCGSRLPLGPFTNLQEIEVFGIRLAQKNRYDSFRIITTEELNELQKKSSSRSEIEMGLNEIGRGIENSRPKKGLESIKTFFN